MYWNWMGNAQMLSSGMVGGSPYDHLILVVSRMTLDILPSWLPLFTAW